MFCIGLSYMMKGCFLCPVHIVNNYPGSTIVISPGKYCATHGSASVTGPCQAGYYCTVGAVRADPQNDTTGAMCPPGNYCPSGTGTPNKCPSGYFSNAYGNTAFSDCKECTLGKYGWLNILVYN